MRAVSLLTAALFTVTALAAEPASLEDALASGKFSVNARLRYEGVTQTVGLPRFLGHEESRYLVRC